MQLIRPAASASKERLKSSDHHPDDARNAILKAKKGSLYAVQSHSLETQKVEGTLGSLRMQGGKWKPISEAIFQTSSETSFQTIFQVVEHPPNLRRWPGIRSLSCRTSASAPAVRWRVQRQGIFFFTFRSCFALQSARAECSRAHRAAGCRWSSQVASVLSRRTGAPRLIAPKRPPLNRNLFWRAWPLNCRSMAAPWPLSCRLVANGIAQWWPKVWPIRGKKSLTLLGVGRLYGILIFPHGIFIRIMPECCPAKCGQNRRLIERCFPLTGSSLPTSRPIRTSP